jgi:hypothetical protein
MTTVSEELDHELELFAWLERKARQRGLKLKIYGEGGKYYGHILELPVWIDVKDVWKKARTLQVIEDSWNNRRKKPAITVFLVPAAKPVRNAPHLETRRTAHARMKRKD